MGAGQGDTGGSRHQHGHAAWGDLRPHGSAQPQDMLDVARSICHTALFAPDELVLDYSTVPAMGLGAGTGRKVRGAQVQRDEAMVMTC